MSTPVANTDLFAVLDVEATGLDVNNDKVVSIAISVVDAEGNQYTEWSTLVNPGIPMGATEFHQLTDDDVKDAPTFAQVAEKFASMVEGKIVTAHNVGYDVGILRNECGRVNQEVKPTSVLCTLDLARRHLGLDENTLGYLAQHYGVVQTKAHDALDDTRVLARILPNLLTYQWRDRQQTWEHAKDIRKGHTWKFPPIVEIRPCTWANPGAWNKGEDLVQGMRVALTGGTDEERIEATLKAQDMGLGIASSVTKTTSLVVVDDPSSRTSKARKAHWLGTSTVSYAEFMTLLSNVKAGTSA